MPHRELQLGSSPVGEGKDSPSYLQVSEPWSMGPSEPYGWDKTPLAGSAFRQERCDRTGTLCSSPRASTQKRAPTGKAINLSPPRRCPGGTLAHPRKVRHGNGNPFRNAHLHPGVIRPIPEFQNPFRGAPHSGTIPSLFRIGERIPNARNALAIPVSRFRRGSDLPHLHTSDPPFPNGQCYPKSRPGEAPDCGSRPRLNGRPDRIF
jgi:hypothetical protein